MDHGEAMRGTTAAPRASSLHLRLPIPGVPAEGARGRELAQFVSDHLLGHEHRHVLAAVVHGDRMADHLGEDRRRAGPRSHHPLRARSVHVLDARHQATLDERPLLRRSTHSGSFLSSGHDLPRPLPRRRPRMISLSDSLCLLRVRFPSVGTPHGVTGWRPPFDFPSPPPCGWSRGFIAERRTEGRLPRQRLLPALPPETFSWSTLPTWPMVARHVSRTRRISPEGRRIVAYMPSFAT